MNKIQEIQNPTNLITLQINGRTKYLPDIGMVFTTNGKTLIKQMMDMKVSAYSAPGIQYNHKYLSITPNVIKILVAESYHININLLEERTRKRKISWPRQVCMFLIRNYCAVNISLGKIGMLFQRDHSTVIHALKIVEDQLKVNLEARKEIIQIIEKIKTQHGITGNSSIISDKEPYGNAKVGSFK